MNPSPSLINADTLVFTWEMARILAPFIALLLGATITLLAAVSVKSYGEKISYFGSLITFGVAALFAGDLYHAEVSQTLFSGMMVVDSATTFFTLLFCLIGIFTVLISKEYLVREQLQFVEYELLVVFSVLGMALLVSALDLIVLFIALELMSLSIYALVAFRRTDRKNNEASIKYFVLGAVASAVLLYGASLLYGATGSMNVHEILRVQDAAKTMTPLFLLGVWLVIIGFLFKIASVPFHVWMPDVYEGAPTPVTGFMTTGVKAAGFAAFIRVFSGLGMGEVSVVHDLIWVCAVLTMVIGNTVALSQTNLKRMLAYSSIAHTGYLLVGFLSAAHSDFGYGPLAFYLVTYSVMNLGAFAALTLLSGRGDVGLNLHDIAGLAKKRPYVAFALAVFLFSMAGIPPAAGFVGKYNLFYSAVKAGETPLVVIAMLTSAVGVFYYLRVIVQMYMKDPLPEGVVPAGPRKMAVGVGLALWAGIILTLQVGVMPAKLLGMTQKIFSKKVNALN